MSLDIAHALLPESANSSEIERIDRAALLLPGSNEVVTLPRPARHHTIIHDLANRGIGIEARAGATQGFTTSTGRFVKRGPAVEIARLAGQLIRKTQPLDQLFSEDLW